jgi:16S rRNA (cytidine1402-2'-O)-methyltransferase
MTSPSRGEGPSHNESGDPPEDPFGASPEGDLEDDPEGPLEDLTGGEPEEEEDPGEVPIDPSVRLPPGLYLLPGPLGNLGDLSRRAAEILAGADLVAAEDTRRTLKLLSHLGLKKRLASYREQNHERDWPKIRDTLRRGGRVVMTSDAGAPVISDPGARLVASARAAGFDVIPVPGPSAVITALMASGLMASSFTFAGFLPPKSSRRRARLEELKSLNHPLVFFESPVRLAESLADMAAVLGPRPALLAREMTKLHEELLAADLNTLSEDVKLNPRRGEMTVVVGPPVKRGESPQAPEADPKSLAEAIAGDPRPTRVLAAELGKTLGKPRKEMYDLVLSIRGRLKGEPD